MVQRCQPYVNVPSTINANAENPRIRPLILYIRNGGKRKKEVTYYIRTKLGVAKFNLKVWIEGWDPNSSQDLATKTFGKGAQLKFEVYKKGLVG